MKSSTIQIDKKEVLAKDLQGKKLCLSSRDNFVTLFEKQVEKTPNHIACIYEDNVINYKYLNERANQFAHYLYNEKEIGIGSFVGIYMDRSIDTIVVLLGILKSGAAYIPLDTSYPTAYLNQITDTAHISLIISKKQFEPLDGYENIIEPYENIKSKLPLHKKCNLNISIAPNQLAHILFTSGSTGNPKGVEAPHTQLINCIQSYCDEFPIAPSEIIAQRTSLSFAVSIKELYAAFISGASIAIIPKIPQDQLALICDYIKKHQITRISLLPSYLSLILKHKGAKQKLLSLKYCLTAGEPLKTEQVRELNKMLPTIQIINNYGCTEMSDICLHKVNSSDLNTTSVTVPVGKPINNVQVYILGENLNPMPNGSIGEIYVGGMSMSLGYHKNQKLTDQKYIANPFSDNINDLLFRTGDMGKRNAMGNVEFIERNDYIVKIRGFRVDLFHLESIVSKFKSIKVGIAVGDINNKLVVYYTLHKKSDFDLLQLKVFLKERLPDYMVPNMYIELETIPRLPNGKINRKSLRKPFSLRIKNKMYQKPETDTENLLAYIWSKTLNIPLETISTTDNFSDLGGDSLSFMDLMLQLKQYYNYSFNVSKIKEIQSLSEFANFIDQIKLKNSIEAESSQKEHPFSDTYIHPVFPNFYWYKSFDTQDQMVVPLRYKSKKKQSKLVKKTMEKLIKKQDQLRGVWLNENNKWFVKIRSFEEITDWYYEDKCTQNCLDLKYKELYLKFIKDSDDSNYLFQVVYINIVDSDFDHVIFLFHHLIIDAFSTKIFTTQFESLLLENQYDLPKKPNRAAKKFSEYFEKYTNERAIEKFEYWTQKKWSKLIDIKSDGDQGIATDDKGMIEGKSLICKFNLQETELFANKIRNSQYAEMDFILLSILIAYHNLCGSEHLFIDIFNNSRNIIDEDLYGEIGWYAQFTHLFLDLNYKHPNKKALEDINRQCNEIIKEHSLSYTCLKFMTKNKEISERMNTYPWTQLSLNYLPKNIIRHNESFVQGAHFMLRVPKKYSPVLIYQYDREGCLTILCNYSPASNQEDTIRNFLSDQKAILMKLLKN